MKKILLTGGLGYIGSHTAVELIASGFEVVVADNLSNTRIEVLDAIEKISGIRPGFEKTDLSDEVATRVLFSKYRFDGCIHFAAYKAVGESVQDPLKYYQNNVFTLVNVLKYLLKSGNGNMVFSSSCTVYGEADSMPITENSPVKKAESPYGNTKQIGEQIIKDSVVAYDNLRAVALRYFNPIGAHKSALLGELPLGVPMNLVPFITQTAAGLRQELKVFGNDYPTPDGTAIRDYIHVVDLACAHVAALNRLLHQNNQERYEVYNIGTGIGSSVLEVIQSFERSTGEKLKWSFAPRRQGDVVQAWADTTKANRELGWKSELSLDEAVRDAWNWQLHLKAEE